MSSDLTGILVVLAVGVPLALLGVLAFGRIESWLFDRRTARLEEARRPHRARDIDRRV